jgi:CubicO group peptidase (beta-lactamase class C family)
VRDLLQHSSGWNVNRNVDDSTWAAVWRDQIFDHVQMARYGRSVALVANPGTLHAYTNYGYQVLGRLIEKVTGKTYEAYVQDAILTPAGVTGMKLGRTPLNLRDPLEVQCYTPLPNTTGFFGTGRWCDVVAEAEYSNSAGAWIASASDMLRWMSVVDGHPGTRSDVLSAGTISTMTNRPAGLWPGNGGYYALGWQVISEAGGLTWLHSGAISGGDGYIARLGNGISIAVLGNRTRPTTAGAQTLDIALGQLIRSISTWPVGTQF